MDDQLKTSFVEAELTKLSLAPGEVLAVRITVEDPDYISSDSLRDLNDQFKKVFPDNKVMIFCLIDGTEMDFTAIQPPPPLPVEACGPQACADCNCGKKERLLFASEEGSLTKLKEFFNQKPGEEE